MTGLELRLVDGGNEAVAETVGPVEFEANCMERWQDSLTVRAYSQRTIDGSVPVLERFLARCGRAVWEVSRDDIDRVMTDLADGGLAASTRSGYLQIFKGFYAFVEQRHGVEIERRFGVVMVNPVDGFNSPTHVASGCEATPAPPTVERLEEFFGSYASRSPRPASTAPQRVTTRCSARCITPGCDPMRPPAST